MSYLPFRDRMARRARPQPVAVDRFLGVDFRSGETAADPRRSPDALNMISGESAFQPRKRTGYRPLFSQALEGPVYGLHRLKNGRGDFLLAHGGTKLYLVQEGGEPRAVYEGMALSPSVSFVMGEKLYLLDGTAYLCFDGEEAFPVRDRAYVPTTSVGRGPQGGGTALEAVNLLTARRTNGLIGDGNSREFQLDSPKVGPEPVTATVDGEELTEGAGFAVDRVWGTVTFDTPPPAAQAGEGISNVFVTFSTRYSHAESIDACRICGVYGGSNDTRVFLTGNPQSPNTDWQSGLYDPTYFPDTGYTRVGADDSPILGYVRQYDSQVIFKAGARGEAAQYLRTFFLDGDGRPCYPVKQGAAGVGPCAPRSFATLLDEPLFLTRDGVRAVTGTNVDAQRALEPRSGRVDSRLLAEPGLEQAAAAVHRDRYHLFVNGRVYVADGRLRGLDELGNTQYEWYYWEGVPALSVLADGEELYFGTEDGRVCRFLREGEPGCYLDDGRPISCRWSTPFLEFGSWGRFKELSSVLVALEPFARSSCRVCYATQDRPPEMREELTVDLLRFEEVDFRRFTFRTRRTPAVYRVRSRERGFHLFQLVLENRDPGYGEGFGLAALELQCNLKNEVK